MMQMRMVGGAHLSIAALNLFSKNRFFGQLGHGNSQGIVESVRRLAGKGKDGCGAEEGMELRAAEREAQSFPALGVGHGFGNSDGKGGADCRGCDRRNVSGIRPGSGHAIRAFAVRGADTSERVAKPKSAAEKPKEEESLKVVEYLNSLRNFEKEGVPRGAGTESNEGFDLNRMSRLLLRLGDPLSKFPVSQFRLQGRTFPQQFWCPHKDGNVGGSCYFGMLVDDFSSWDNCCQEKSAVQVQESLDLR